MAREASITIDCSRYSDRIIDVISLLNEIGWKYYNNSNQIEFLPIGDNDNFNWLKKSISVDEIKKIIDKKQCQSEIVGVNLFFNDSGVGMSLLAYTTSKIMFSLNINRKVVGNTKDKITDITWYFNNIIIKLQENNCNIDYFQIEDYRY